MAETQPFVVPLLLGVAADFVLKSIENDVAVEIAKYTGGFTASRTDHFYQTSNGKAVPMWSCIRFVRLADDPNTNKQVAVFDLVAKLEVMPDYLVIKPLRLYYKRSVATLGDDKKISLAVNLKGNTIWRQGDEGQSAQLFAGNLLAVTCTMRKDADYWYAASIADSSPPRPLRLCSLSPKSSGVAIGVSLREALYNVDHLGHVVHGVGEDPAVLHGIIAASPPYSVGANIDNATAGGLLTLTASEAEVSAPPKILCEMSNALADQGTAFEGALITAIDDRLYGQSTRISVGKGGGGGGGGSSKGGGSAAVSVNPCSN